MQNVGIQTGPGPNERPSIFFKDNTSTGLGINNVSVTTQANAQATMTTLETALTSISDELSRAGAYENRFSHTIAVQELTAKLQKLHVVESWMPILPKSPPGSQKHRSLLKPTQRCWLKQINYEPRAGTV